MFDGVCVDISVVSRRWFNLYIYIYVHPNIIYKVEVRLLSNLQSSPFNVTHVCLLWQEIRFSAYENKYIFV